VRLAAVVEAAIETARPLIDAQQHAFEVELPPQDLWITVDSVRIAQAIGNLLHNAAKFTPKAGRVSLEAKRDAGELVIRVEDNGAGITPETLASAFDLFTQGDRSLDRSQGGLGIGLTIVRHLVAMHGGRVTAESAGLGQGSEFQVFLPRTEAPQFDLPDAGSSQQRPTPKRRVLVVDDNRDAAESLRELLRMHGHDVEVVNDGAGAIAALDDFRADVVMLDLGLPRVDGFMVAHAIRARFAQSKKRPRLLALTGHGREEDRQAALRSGFDGHLVKPVEPDLLLRVVAEEGRRVNVGELI